MAHSLFPKRTGTSPAVLWLDALLLAVLSTILSIQLFIPPFIGLADNGDFPKISGLFSLTKDQRQNFRYFVSEYEYSQNSYDRGLRFSGVVPAAAAIYLSRLIHGPKQFDIRYLGLCHGIMFLLTFYLFLVFLRRYPLPTRATLAALSLWIFSDVAYVSYFNSFYSDTIAYLGLLLMTVTALHIATNNQSRWVFWVLFSLAAILFTTSKAQHGLWAVFPAAFAVWSGFMSGSRLRKLYGCSLCAVLLLTSAVEFFLGTPKWYKATALYSVIFLKVLQYSPAPERDIQSLGLSPGDLRNVGLTPWRPHSPVADEKWLTKFYGVASRSLPRFYLHHPKRVLQLLMRDLKEHGAQIRFRELANFRQADGYPPGALATRFSSWSWLRTALLSRWPSMLVLWYLLIIAVCMVSVVNSSDNLTSRLSAICLGIVAMAMLEYCFASLSDALQTERHLFLFHAMTDVTFCFAAGALLTGKLSHTLKHFNMQKARTVTVL